MSKQRPPRDATYIGDGLYAWYDSETLIIAAFTGFATSDIVYLDAPTCHALQAYLTREKTK